MVELPRFVVQVLGNFTSCLSLACELVRRQVTERGMWSFVVVVTRVNYRRVLNGILWVLRSGAPWRDLPESYGPPTTCYKRFVRWR